MNDSITDGPGLRLVIFMQGCRRHCPGCHNPTALDFGGGSEYALEELWRMVEGNPLLSGVTFSGGEPLLQAGALISLAARIRRAGLSLAIYSGYTLEEIMEENNPLVMGLLAHAHTLVDGPYIQAKRSLALPFRGSSNQRILNVSQSIKQAMAVLQEDEQWLS